MPRTATIRQLVLQAPPSVVAGMLGYHVVHTHLVHADVYGGIAATLRGTKLVSTKHNDDPFRLGAFRYVERGLARVTDRIVTIMTQGSGKIRAVAKGVRKTTSRIGARLEFAQ